MMKTNARETRRFPAGSIGTGRHSARIAKQKNITIPSTERGLGCDMTAVTAAPATTGAPTTHVAKTYQCSRDGNVRAESERRRMSFRQAELVRLLRPAGARAAGDGERRKRSDRNRSSHVPSLPTNHRRASSIKVAKYHRSRRTKGFRTTPRITRPGDHASPAAVMHNLLLASRGRPGSPFAGPQVRVHAIEAEALVKRVPDVRARLSRYELALRAQPVRVRVAALLEVDEVRARGDVLGRDLDLLLARRALRGRLVCRRLRQLGHA